MISTTASPFQMINLGPATFAELLRASGVPAGSTVQMSADGSVKQIPRPASWSKKARKTTPARAAAKFTPQDFTAGPRVARVAAGIKFKSPKTVTFPSN